MYTFVKVVFSFSNRCLVLDYKDMIHRKSYLNGYDALYFQLSR